MELITEVSVVNVSRGGKLIDSSDNQRSPSLNSRGMRAHLHSFLFILLYSISFRHSIRGTKRKPCLK